MEHHHKTYLIFGVSKGLGKALALTLPNSDDLVYGVSRTRPDYLDDTPNIRWISADLSTPTEAVRVLKKEIDIAKIDYFIYNVGIWERDGFSADYTFASLSQEELMNIIATNLTSCILTIQAFIENLKQSQNPKIIFIGSTWGLDNHNGKEVAFSATKFGLRGVIHSLRENLREYSIGVSIVNLGYLATEFEITVSTEVVLERTNGALIPLTDVVQAIKFITSTSYASCVKEIHMPAMQDLNM